MGSWIHGWVVGWVGGSVCGMNGNLTQVLPVVTVHDHLIFPIHDFIMIFLILELTFIENLEKQANNGNVQVHWEVKSEVRNSETFHC